MANDSERGGGRQKGESSISISLPECKCAKREGKESSESMQACRGEEEQGSRGEGESDGRKQSRRGRGCERVSNREGV